MKRIICLFFVLCILVFFVTSCSLPYDFDLREYLTVGSYTGIEISLAEIETKLEENIKQLLDQNSTENEITNRPVKNGDIANIDYTGTLNGETFAGGSATNYDLEIGSGAFVDGFEEGIIGKNIGETFDVKTVFPQDYNNETLAGQEVNFNIKLNSIKEKTIPELNDEFIKNYTDYETLDEYKTETHASLKENYVWNKAVENTVIKKYPKQYVEKYYNNMIDSYKSYAMQYGYTIEQFVSQSTGQTIEDFLKQAAEYAKSQVKQEMVMYSIARNENITVDNNEYKTKSVEFAERFGYKTVAEMEKAFTKDTVKMNMLMEKVVDYVTGLSVEKD